MKYYLRDLWRWVIAAVVGLAGLGGTGTAVWAHANLVKSAPTSGERLEQAPQEIVLAYTEELDPAFTKVEVRNAAGKVVVSGAGTIAAENTNTLRLALDALPEDGYSAIWRVRSLVDGHISLGAVTFAVGKDTPLPSLLPQPGAATPVTARPEPLEVVLRWLGYLALALTLGPLCFGLFVWQRAYGHALGQEEIDAEAKAELRRVGEHVVRGLRRLVIVSSIGIAVLSLLFVFYQAGRLATIMEGGTLGRALLGLLAGTTLPTMGARLAMLVGLWLLVTELSTAQESLWAWRITLVMGIGLAFSFTMQGHVAAFGSRVRVLLDMAHLLAMSAWLGGLVALVWTLRWRGVLPLPFWAMVVRRFSGLALISVGGLALTGLYNAYNLVGDPAQLLATTYGQALAVKVGLFGLLMLLGAVNLLVISPRLARQTTGVGWLRSTTRSEIVGAGLALAAAATMTAVSPAADALLAQRRLGVVAAQRQGDVQFTVWIAPAQAGDNEFAVDVVDNRVGVDEQRNPLQVLLRLTYLTMATGVQQVELTPQGQGRYALRGSYLPLEGQWRAEVILRRSGFDDVRHTVELDTLDKVFP